MTVEVTPDTDDLDAFNALLHGHAVEKVEAGDEATPPDEEVEEEVLEDDPLETEPEEDEPEEVVEKPKKKNSAQERINELARERREAREEAARLKAELEALKAPKEAPPVPKAAPAVDEPTPDDLDDGGNPKYPLGEFDPKFIKDLQAHTFKSLENEFRESLKRQEEEAKKEQTRIAVETEWNGKLEAATERYPDLIEKNLGLADTFADLDPQYADYLASTIMQMDNGVDVLYHLANNLDLAKNVVQSGALKATLALGAISERYKTFEGEKKEKKLKVTSAPQPPERLNRGTSVSAEIADDTDDLDAFTRKMYGRRK